MAMMRGTCSKGREGKGREGKGLVEIVRHKRFVSVGQPAGTGPNFDPLVLN